MHGYCILLTCRQFFPPSFYSMFSLRYLMLTKLISICGIPSKLALHTIVEFGRAKEILASTVGPWKTQIFFNRYTVGPLCPWVLHPQIPTCGWKTVFLIHGWDPQMLRADLSYTLIFQVQGCGDQCPNPHVIWGSIVQCLPFKELYQVGESRYLYPWNNEARI